MRPQESLIHTINAYTLPLSQARQTWPADIQAVPVHTAVVGVRGAMDESAKLSFREQLAALPQAIDDVPVGSLHRPLSYLAVAALLQGDVSPHQESVDASIRLGALGRHVGILSVKGPESFDLSAYQGEESKKAEQELADKGFVFFQLLPGEQ